MLAEPPQTPSAPAPVGRPAFLPYQRERHAIAAQLQVNPTEVGLDHASLLGSRAAQSPFQFRLTKRGDRLPVLQAAGGGQQ